MGNWFKTSRLLEDAKERTGAINSAAFRIAYPFDNTRKFQRGSCLKYSWTLFCLAAL